MIPWEFAAVAFVAGMFFHWWGWGEDE